MYFQNSSLAYNVAVGGMVLMQPLMTWVLLKMTPEIEKHALRYYVLLSTSHKLA